MAAGGDDRRARGGLFGSLCARRRPEGGPQADSHGAGGMPPSPLLHLFALDRHQLCKVRPNTLEVYRKHVAAFHSWYVSQGYSWASLEDLDMLLVLWKNWAGPSKAAFVNALAGVELAWPWAKGSLAWAHMVQAGWSIDAPPQHTLPRPMEIALVFSACWVRSGLRRVGAFHMLQRRRGHRPRESLQLRAGDITFPRADSARTGMEAVVIHFGVRQGTKNRRPEADVVLPSDQRSQEILYWLCDGLSPRDLLAGPFQYGTYRSHMERFATALRMLPYRPHGPRAGYASECFVRGVPVPEIQAQLRHNDPRSLRTYLDAVSLMNNHVQGDAARWADAAGVVDAHWWEVLNGSAMPWAWIHEASPISLDSVWSRPRHPRR
ncbi:hypothetical protein N9L68_01745 [bacterium]|nr:hypothetical protein [bacterium]